MCIRLYRTKKLKLFLRQRTVTHRISCFSRAAALLGWTCFCFVCFHFIFGSNVVFFQKFLFFQQSPAVFVTLSTQVLTFQQAECVCRQTSDLSVVDSGDDPGSRCVASPTGENAELKISSHKLWLGLWAHSIPGALHCNEESDSAATPASGNAEKKAQQYTTTTCQWQVIFMYLYMYIYVCVYVDFSIKLS